MFQTRFKRFEFDGTYNNLPSMTSQSEKDKCDINVLYQRFVKEHDYDPILDGPPVEVDMNRIMSVPMVDGLQGMFDKVAEAEEIFGQLPSEVRAAYNNNPAMLGEALNSTDPKVLERVGLVLKGGTTNETPLVPQQKPENVPQNSNQVA